MRRLSPSSYRNRTQFITHSSPVIDQKKNSRPVNDYTNGGRMSLVAVGRFFFFLLFPYGLRILFVSIIDTITNIDDPVSRRTVRPATVVHTRNSVLVQQWRTSKIIFQRYNTSFPWILKKKISTTCLSKPNQLVLQSVSFVFHLE